MPEQPLSTVPSECYERGYRDGIRRMADWMDSTAALMEQKAGSPFSLKPFDVVLRAKALHDHASDFRKFANEAPWDEVRKA